MLKYVLIIILAVATIWTALHAGGADERIQEASLADNRVRIQDEILSALEAMNNSTVSEFVSDWRKAFPKPESSNLSELRIIEQRINNDVTSAATMTLGYRMKNSPLCNGQVIAIIPSFFETETSHCKPGL